MLSKKKPKAKKKNTKIKKSTITMNHFFSSDVSKILDILGKTSKDTFNHYFFCFKFFQLYKNKVYEDTFLYVIKNNIFNKDIINDFIENKFKIYYELYQSDFAKYISNNNIIYNYIKTLKLNIDNNNFIKIYNNLIVDCLSLDKLNISTSNLHFLYEENIYSILNSFYYYKYYNVKNGLINKKPITVVFDDNFKKHVMNTEKPIKFFEIKNHKEVIANYLTKNKENKENEEHLHSEQNLISKLVYFTIKFPKTSSDIIINTITKAYQTIKSYYALKELGFKANKPRYIKTDFYSIIFCGKTIKNYIDKKEINKVVINNEKNKVDKPKLKLKLSYGKNITNNWFEYFNEELLKKPLMLINKPSILRDGSATLTQIEIIKIAKNKYKVHYKINKEKKTKEEITSVKLSETLSIDLGMTNLMTIHDPNGKQYIIKGGHLICINEYYNKKISYYQSKRDTEINTIKKEYYNNEMLLLNEMRLRKLNGKMNQIVSKLKELYSDKKIIVIGYNEGWKTKVNMGKENNRKFYEIPYSKLISKMRNVFEETTEIKEINEAYTSKCDALGNESIEKHEIYKGERIKRGLFSSSIGKLINADLNGAINILRKFCGNKYKKIKV